MKWNQRLIRFAFDDAPPLADRAAWDTAIAYWESRGFRCARAPGDDQNGNPQRVPKPSRDVTRRAELAGSTRDRVVGRRGNWAGNLFSFDIQRVVCDLDVRRDGPGAWSVSMLLEGAFQILTEWNVGELMLEPLMFRRTMLGLPSPPDLGRYREATRRASVASSLSLTILGRRLPEFWRQLFRQIAAPYELPTVERVRV